MLPWWEWLVLPTPELRALGYKSTDRVKYCGHQRALTTRWSLSVGMWGGTARPLEIQLRVGCGRASYDQFLWYWNLETSEREEPLPQWIPAMAAYQILNAMGPVPGGFGAAAHWAAKKERVGMLPVELFLRHTAMTQVLAEHGLSAKQFVSKDFDNTQRSKLWLQVDTCIALPPRVARDYASA